MQIWTVELILWQSSEQSASSLSILWFSFCFMAREGAVSELPATYGERKQLYDKISSHRNSSVLAYVTGDRPGLETQMADDVVPLFGDLLDRYDGASRISLFLYTRGGNTLTAWSLVNLLREFTHDLEIIVPSKCHSAGTLTVLGADRVLMTKQATLGPIDPSINGPLNPGLPGRAPEQRLPVSVEDIAGYIGLAQEEADIRDPRGLAQVFLKLAEEVHPIALGGVKRARSQIEDLARKLLSLHMDEEESQETIDRVVRVLCREAGSHDYMIYRREARQVLNLPIETPSWPLYEDIRDIQRGFRREMELDVPFNPHLDFGLQVGQSTDYSLLRAAVETQDDGGYHLKRCGRFEKAKDNQGNEVIQDHLQFDGWKSVS